MLFVLDIMQHTWQRLQDEVELDVCTAAHLRWSTNSPYITSYRVRLGYLYT